MVIRFFHRLFSRSNSLDYTCCCGHTRDYLAGAAINEPPLIHNLIGVLVTEGVDKAGWQIPAKCGRP